MSTCQINLKLKKKKRGTEKNETEKQCPLEITSKPDYASACLDYLLINSFNTLFIKLLVSSRSLLGLGSNHD